jgi:hypothetical protein
MQHWWNRQTKKFETSASANFSTTNPMWTGLEMNPGLRSEKPMSSHLRYGITTVQI